MANILVVIELAGDRVHPGALELLGQARRLGSQLGATVFALAPCAKTPGYSEDDLIAVLSRGGADKVLLATAESFAGPMRWGTHGPLLLSVCAQRRPALLLLAATDGGRDLGARAAALLGAALLVDAWVEADDKGLTLWDGSGESAHRLDGELEFAVVAEVPPGRYLPGRGDDEAEVEVVTPPPPSPGEFEEIAATPEPARVVVLGAGPAAETLGQALGAATAVAPDLAIALLPTEPPPGESEAWRRAAVRVALGRDAAACAGARYAVEGDAAQLGAELARLVGASPTGGGA